MPALFDFWQLSVITTGTIGMEMKSETSQSFRTNRPTNHPTEGQTDQRKVSVSFFLFFFRFECSPAKGEMIRRPVH